MDSPDPTPHLERFDSYAQAYQQFSWAIPKRFNIAREICRRHTDAVTRIAIGDAKEDGINTYTFGGLDFLSDKFATALSESGIGQGDSIAVVLQPSAALAIAHLGALKTGSVVVPVSNQADAAFLEFALRDSDSSAVVVDESHFAKIDGLASKLPKLKSRFVVRDLRVAGASSEVKDFWAAIDRASSQFEPAETDASSPAFIFYLDLQGEITGVVHSHRSAIGQLSAFELVTASKSDAVPGTIGDWSRADIVMGLLYPSLWYGFQVVAVTTYEPDMLQSEVLTDVYGKPETGWILGKYERWFAAPAGSVGRPAPGRWIEIIGETGDPLLPGQTGSIAVHKSDPGLFIGYHRAAARTAAAFIGDWFLTGDVGYRDAEGNFFIEP